MQIRVDLGKDGLAAQSARLGAPPFVNAPLFLLGVVAALCAALAVVLHATTGSQAPDLSWLNAELGHPTSSAPLTRPSAGGFDVSLSGGAVHATRGSTHVDVATLGVGGTWRSHANGMTRATSFGSETITIGPRKTEIYLRVDRRQGTRNWRWQIRTDLAPRLLASGAVELRGRHALTIAPVSIYDRAGRDITPPGTRWTLIHRAGGWLLGLRLNDAKLPLPYVIDPILGPSYASVVAADLPISYWRLGESALPPCASGAAAATGSSPVPGTYSATGVTCGVASTALQNDANTAATFNGSTGAVDLGTAASLRTATFSIEAWFKTTALKDQKIFRQRTYGNALGLNAAGQVVGWYYDAVAFQHGVVSPSGYADGSWHHAVVTYNGTSVILYVDGASVGTHASIIPPFYGGDGAAIGQDGNVVFENFDGTIDEVAYYPVALTAARVALHYNVAIDKTPPTAAVATAPAGTTNSAGPATVSFTASDSGGSGLAAGTYERRIGTFANGSCGSYSAYASITPTGGGTPASDTFSQPLSDATCFQYRYTPKDNALNTGDPAESAELRVDRTAPMPTISASPTGTTNSAGPATITFSVTDAGGSNLASSAFERRTGTFTGGACDYTGQAFVVTTPTSGTTASGTYTEPATFPTGTCFQYRESGTDGATNTASATTEIRVDRTAPVPAISASPSGATSSSGPATITFSVTDAGGSNLASSAFERHTGTLTGGVCDYTGQPFAPATPTTGTTASGTYNEPTLTNGTCYQYRETGTDGATNTANATTEIRVSIAPVAPAAPAPIVPKPTFSGADPADGATVASAKTITLKASAEVDWTELKMRFTPQGGGSSTSTLLPYGTGQSLTRTIDATAAGLYNVTGRITNGGGTLTFSTHFTVPASSGQSAPPSERTVSPAGGGTLTSSTGNEAVIWTTGSMPNGLLRIEPMTLTGPIGGFTHGGRALNVTLVDPDGSPVHTLSAPIEIVFYNASSGDAPAVSNDGVNWSLLTELPDHLLHADQSDGYWTQTTPAISQTAQASTVTVHVLTRHLTVFGLLRDSEAPTAPTNLTGTIAANTLTLKWQAATDNSGSIASYEVVVDGQQAMTVSGSQTTATISPFPANDTRVYQIIAYDAAGNLSPVSPGITQVPNVIGLSLQEATAKIIERRFAVGNVVMESGATSSTATVTGETPATPAMATVGSQIDLQATSGSGQATLVNVMLGARRLYVGSRLYVRVRIKLTLPVELSAYLTDYVERWWESSPGSKRYAHWQRSVGAGAHALRFELPKGFHFQKGTRYRMELHMRHGSQVAVRRTRVFFFHHLRTH